MGKYFLFIILLVITIFSYKKTIYKYLSPTFISASVFMLQSLGYIILNKYIGRDISFQAIFLISMSEISVCIGEYIANKIRIFKKYKRERENSELFYNIESIQLSNYTIIFFSILSFTVAILRYVKVRNLLRISGSFSFLAIAGYAREESLKGNLGMNTMGIWLSGLYYLVLVAAYLFILIYIQTRIKKGENRYTLLVPVLGYCCCVVSATSRIQFIQMACTVIASIFISFRFEKKKSINFTKIVTFGVIFVAFFLWYGFVARGATYLNSSSIVYHFLGYSGAALYGLDEYLNHPWAKSNVFGKYMFNGLYELMGISYSTILPDYALVSSSSNIYTSLAILLHDFGITGMILYYIFLSFLYVKNLQMCLEFPLFSSKFNIMFLFLCHNIYIFFKIPFGESSHSLIFNPKYLIAILVSYFIVSFLGFNVIYSVNGILNEGKRKVKILFGKRNKLR